MIVPDWNKKKGGSNMDKVKRNEEMERVSKVFKEYIEDSPYLEWL